MKRLILFSIILTVLTSCKKNDSLPSDKIIDLGGERWVRTEIDNIIYNDFIKTYNIEVKYKWSPFEINFNRTLVPPMEFQVEPVLSAIKKIWMEPYEKIGGKDFLKKHPITKFVLVGSPEFQNTGGIVLGSAEGGTRINIYNVNNFFIRNQESVKQMLHTIHHEYVHILHQTIHYPQEWRGLSTKWYTETWFNTPEFIAQTEGLVSSYAKSSEREDFAETVTFLLIKGQEEYNKLISSNPDVAHIYKSKQSIIENYFKNAFNIDFKTFQFEVQNAIKNITQIKQ